MRYIPFSGLFNCINVALMKEYLRLILILLIPLMVLLAYSLSGYRLMFNGWSMGKIKIPVRILDAMTWKKDFTGQDICAENLSVQSDKDIAEKDTVASDMDEEVADIQPLDTASKRILFFGDSMVEGLSMRFSDYAVENGHQLYSVCWYGSSIHAWASATDSIENMLAWARPDYVVVSLGGNELRARDLDRRREDICKIQSLLDSLPTVWIAPPSWVRNPTITGVIEQAVGTKRYFDSTRLSYTRGSDNMHPTFGSSARWMDSIAVWLSSPSTAHPIVMDKPARRYPRKWNKRFIFPH